MCLVLSKVAFDSFMPSVRQSSLAPWLIVCNLVLVTLISDAFHLKAGSWSCYMLQMWHTFCWKIHWRKFGQSSFVHILAVHTVCLDNWIILDNVCNAEKFPHGMFVNLGVTTAIQNLKLREYSCCVLLLLHFLKF